MADYQLVVGMLGDNLASFLELGKKWLVDLKIDPKRLLHGLHQINKDSLLGFLAGTHEIRVKITSRAEPFLKFVAPGKKLTIGPTSGKRTVEDARSTFQQSIYCDFIAYPVRSELTGSPTDAADAEVYRVAYEGDDTNGFTGLLERFRIDLPKLALTFEQVELFCLEHDDWLREHNKRDRYYFLIKNKAENLFVGKMGFGHSGRYIDIKEIRENDCGAYCYVGAHIVVQQQTD